MRLREFVPDRDLEELASWITDERTHALWCAGRTDYPLSAESFAAFLEREQAIGTRAFTAVNEDGCPAGFICIGRIGGTNEAMLKFVVVSPKLRGKGLGQELVKLAAGCAFETEGVSAVQLMVFSVNERAVRCYTAAGFAVRAVTEGAFRFGDELWDRINMVKYKDPHKKGISTGNET